MNANTPRLRLIVRKLALIREILAELKNDAQQTPPPAERGGQVAVGLVSFLNK